MAKAYELNGRVRAINRLVGALNRFGWAGSSTYTITTTGRKSGRPRSTPVTVAVIGGARYLVAPYGAVGWVHNIRPSGNATLRRKGRTTAIRVRETEPEEAGAVLKHYVATVKIVRPYFAADAPVAAFVAEADRHPVFRIEE